MDQATQTAVKELSDETAKIEAIVKKAIADYKSGGIKNVAQDIPAIVAEVPQAIQVVQRDLPTIKAGRTTTEWILILVVILGQGVLDALGHPLPVAEAVAIDTLAAIYTIARSFVKTSAASTGVVTTTAPVTTTITTK